MKKTALIALPTGLVLLFSAVGPVMLIPVGFVLWAVVIRFLLREIGKHGSPQEQDFMRWLSYLVIGLPVGVWLGGKIGPFGSFAAILLMIGLFAGYVYIRYLGRQVDAWEDSLIT